MLRRGRDRTVPEAAKARLKSLERSRNSTRPLFAASRSPSPPSSASLSPRSPASRSPTPPLTLSDQVHIAYAEDDIHLAKVLLLRLQGIEVTSDSDPRIAAVKDEDFDACFIPFGRLDDGRGDQSTISKHAPPPVAPDVLRAEALRAKERLWETEARRFTEERCKYAALKRRQTDYQRAMAVEQERLRLVRQKEAAAAAVDLRRRRIKPTARTLNFALVPPVAPPPQKFTYDFPFTPRNITPRTVQPPRRSPPRSEPRDEPQQEIREPNRVTFQQVLASIQGELFPVLPCERTLSSSADRTKARRQHALLDALLVSGADLDFTGKGKGRATPQRCAGCSPRAPSPTSPSTPSTSSSGLSRAGSWLSFGGSSSRSSTISTSTAASSWVSASTILSSPADSPPPIKSPPLRSLAWLPGARRTTSPSPMLSNDHLHHAFLCPRHRRDAPRTATQTHPLVPPEPPNEKEKRRRPPVAGDHPQGAGAVPFTLALGRLATLARNLQAAYVRAVVVGYGGVSPEWDMQEEREEETYAYDWEEKEKQGRQQPKFAPPPVPLASKLRVRAPGTRAARADVRCFLSLSPSPSPSPSSSSPSSSPSADDDLAPHARLSPLPPKAMYTHPPARTPLPAHLPYAIVFAPPKPLPRSPWAMARGREGPLPPTAGPVPCSAAKALERARARAMGVGASASRDANSDSGDAPRDEESSAEVEVEDEFEYQTKPRTVLRARAVPNSAFLRVKALHHDALELGLPARVVGAGGKEIQIQTRRPRECVVGLGVDRAPGSGLRFVYADVRGVGVGG
ncbi:hypothetical protein B0H19DRAFT_1276887 [Mycena capillaripes]|nr:hypothetical protein B0H19DRAFT_1276887 [Mycena capillaripes]